MTWNLPEQCLTLVFSSILIARLVKWNAAADYPALICFAALESLEAVVYLAIRWFSGTVQQFVDYRYIFTVERCLEWATTIWLVYGLLVAILRQLPGILRFSLRYLNATFAIAVIIAIATVWPEYFAASGAGANGWDNWKARMTNLSFVLERAISFAELLAILSILVFVLFFPFRVPKNLAIISTVLCLMLSMEISLLLVRSYHPSFSPELLGSADEVISLGCLAYFAFAINKQGQVSRVTLGRGWQTVPHEHLVRQLEALNAALLGARETDLSH